MKSLQPLVFAAHTALKPQIPSIKKSHLYEAFAAFTGFKSYAAFNTTKASNIQYTEHANRQCLERMLKIGFEAKDAYLISQQTELMYDQFQQIDIGEIYRYYAEADFDESSIDSEMLHALTNRVVAGEPEAILMGMVFISQLVSEYEEEPDNRGGKYWHNRLVAKQPLNDFQRAVAEEYEEIQKYREFLTLIKSKLRDSSSTTLPSPPSIKSYCKHFDDGLVRNWTKHFVLEPYEVLEAIAYIDEFNDDGQVVFEHIYRDWEKAEALSSPSTWQLAEIIKASSTVREKWFWHHVGLHQEVDVTESDLRAIHAYTGEDYDDYGPIDVVGYEGISMPEVEKTVDDEMRLLALGISRAISV